MVRAKKQHGGSRDGTVGKATPNRTDLNTAVPKMAAPAAGREHGAKQADLQAQDVVPVAAPQGPMPGELGPLNAPTNRPNEPITTGIARGPGAGPEVMATRTQLQPSSALEKLAMKTNDPFLLSLLKRR